ncbi:uncharacterized protein LOC132195495 [Neocloeon triangulifer]|uniref:uncharacterized protein LOC132195495 n=1 Tax=Neocloeon triangulifer TaxID=2078957 RepID=UPI00286EE3F1|nr:uncharacterized protein LOC132195495 [Neocloeon triangulifer]
MDDEVDSDIKPCEERTLNTFPYKLWNLINNYSEKNGLEWSKNGDAVLVQKKLFVQKCLGQPKKFKTKKLLSITKQFNVYGFKQIHHEESDAYFKYKSPNFKKDRPELLSNFSRRISTSRRPYKKYSAKSDAKRKTKDKRVALSSVENFTVKTRSQPVRQARRPLNAAALTDSLSSSQETNNSESSQENQAIETIKLPVLQKEEIEEIVVQARDQFRKVLQENVDQVLQLPTGLTSSNQSSQSSFTLDVSNKPVMYPPPPKRDPQRVMLNGNCPSSPNVSGTINPNAFFAPPWNSYLDQDMRYLQDELLQEEAIPFEHILEVSEICDLI